MTILTQRMREELVRRNYAETTIRTYLLSVEQFREYARKRLDHLGPDDMRRYQAYLLENKKLAVGTVVLQVSALRFLYVKVLGRRDMKQELPYPKHRKRLPTILSPDEAALLIDSARTLFHRAMLMTLYSAGLRRSELCRLKVADIDSQRMMLRVERGKGGVDREVPLSQKLLETLREHYRWIRPKTYLFPGTINNWRVDKPITPKVVWMAVREATERAGIHKRVTPHTLRHCYATHLLESGADLRTIQLLMGHVDIEATTVYLHLSQKHLQAAANPLDQLAVSSTAHIERSRRLHKPAWAGPTRFPMQLLFGARTCNRTPTRPCVCAAKTKRKPPFVAVFQLPPTANLISALASKRLLGHPRDACGGSKHRLRWFVAP